MASDKKGKLFTTVSHQKLEGKILKLIPRVITSKTCICFKQTEQLKQCVLCTVNVMYVEKHDCTSRHILKDE